MKLVLLHWVGRYWWLALENRYPLWWGGVNTCYQPIYPLGDGVAGRPPLHLIDNLAGIEMPVIRA